MLQQYEILLSADACVQMLGEVRSLRGKVTANDAL